MIHYMNHNGLVQLHIDGDLETIISDTEYMVMIVYKELLKKSVCAAELYRDFFENHSKNFFDFVFDDAHKKGTENIESCEKALNDLLHALEYALKNEKKGGDENA